MGNVSRILKILSLNDELFCRRYKLNPASAVIRFAIFANPKSVGWHPLGEHDMGSLPSKVVLEIKGCYYRLDRVVNS